MGFQYYSLKRTFTNLMITFVKTLSWYYWNKLRFHRKRIFATIERSLVLCKGASGGANQDRACGTKLWAVGATPKFVECREKINRCALVCTSFRYSNVIARTGFGYNHVVHDFGIAIGCQACITSCREVEGKIDRAFAGGSIARKARSGSASCASGRSSGGSGARVWTFRTARQAML